MLKARSNVRDEPLRNLPPRVAGRNGTTRSCAVPSSGVGVQNSSQNASAAGWMSLWKAVTTRRVEERKGGKGDPVVRAWRRTWQARS